MGKKITLTTEAFDKALAEIKAVDAKLIGLKGSAAEWQKKATEATKQVQLIPSSVLAIMLNTSANLVAISDLLESATDEVKNARKELATLWIKANRKDSDETAALTTRRATLVENAEALRNLFGQAGIELAEIPKAPRANGSVGGSALSTPKGVQFWAKRKLNEDGTFDMSTTYELPSSNNSLGGVGWYVFGEASSELVKDALKAAGWDGTLTTSTEGFDISVEGKKCQNGPKRALVGWTVTGKDSSVTDPAKQLAEEQARDEAK